MKETIKQSGGISIRVTHIAMILLGVLTVALFGLSLLRTSDVFSTLNKATGNYIVRQDAAHDLMEASDYLTEMVQRYTLDGDRQYMDNYFEEAFTAKRRENAVLTMTENEAEQNMVDQIQTALNESNNLMFTEYYAMKLVVDATELRDYPETLKGVELKDADAALTADEKMERAQKMVMGEDYYAHKDVIRNNLRASLSTMDQLMTRTRQETTGQLNKELGLIRGFTIAVGVMLLIMIGLMTMQGTVPLERAEKALEEGRNIPVTGAREFRHLARSYNALKKAQEPAEPAEDKGGNE